MKLGNTILTLLLLANGALASEVAPAQTESAKPAPEKSVPSAPPILALAPADALAIVYASQPTDLFEHPFWEAAGATRDAQFAGLLKAAGETLNGPVMIAVCGSPLNPLSLRVELAIQPADGAEAFFERLGGGLLSVLGKAAMDPAAGVQPSGAMYAIRLPAPFPITVLAADKNGVIYGSSRPGDVTAWLEGQELPPRFVDGDDAQKLAADDLQRSDAFVYLNTRGLMPMLGTEMERAMPGLYTALGIGRLEFGALLAEWSRGGFGMQAKLSWPDGDVGVLDLLAPKNAPVEIATLVPSDYTFFVRGALTSVAEWSDSIGAIAGAIDGDLVSEFRDECAEFREDYGFDPLADFAGNLVDEWIVAGRVDAGGNVAAFAAVGLADSALFESHARRLIRGFDLEVEAQACGNAQVYAAPADSGVHVAWGTVNDYLVMSNRADAVCEVIKSQYPTAEAMGHPVVVRLASQSPAAETMENPQVQTLPALRGVMRNLPAESAQLSFVNLGELARLALDAAGDDPEIAEITDMLKRLSASDAGLAVAIEREGGALTVQLATSDGVNAEVREAAWRSLAASLARSRELARRAVSATNLRGLAQACLLYASDHKGAWPASLAELLEAGVVGPQMFRAPYDGPTVEITAANADRESSYLYRDGTDVDPSEVVLCERELRGDGANFAFADGHVEWITGPRARTLRTQMLQLAQR